MHKYLSKQISITIHFVLIKWNLYNKGNMVLLLVRDSLVVKMILLWHIEFLDLMSKIRLSKIPHIKNH